MQPRTVVGQLRGKTVASLFVVSLSDISANSVRLNLSPQELNNYQIVAVLSLGVFIFIYSLDDFLYAVYFNRICPSSSSNSSWMSFAQCSLSNSCPFFPLISLNSLSLINAACRYMGIGSSTIAWMASQGLPAAVINFQPLSS